ncbi:dynein heavy chain and region D6 of dynein motor-domain-containing protein [Zopfochytrium polystomum]|nr:dynein heavy chain and region D6 of dynein motor-domain-containing protein [Zopfochytrium polystomum]
MDETGQRFSSVASGQGWSGRPTAQQPASDEHTGATAFHRQSQSSYSATSPPRRPNFDTLPQFSASPTSSASTTASRKKTPIAGSGQRGFLERRGVQTAALLQQRLYTTSSRTENPYFTVRLGTAASAGPTGIMGDATSRALASAPAGLTGGTLASPASLWTSMEGSDPAESRALSAASTRLPIAQAVEFAHNAEPFSYLSRLPSRESHMVVLRAKKPSILPVASADPSGRGPKTSGRLPRPPNIDPELLQQVIRPTKRTFAMNGEDLSHLIVYGGVDEAKLDDGAEIAGGVRLSPLGQLPVIPPIQQRPATQETSGVVTTRPPMEGGAVRLRATSAKKVRLTTPAVEETMGTPQVRRVVPMEVDKNVDEDETIHAPQHGDAEEQKGTYAVSKPTTARSANRSLLRSRGSRAGTAFSLGSEGKTETRAMTDPFEFIKYLEHKGKTKEFVYLNAKKSQLTRGTPTYNPYNLEIVDYIDVDKKNGYFTLSSQGLTRFNELGHGDFTPLHQWLREHHLFHKLLKIRFFANYRIWSCFISWRRTVLRTKIKTAKRLLAKSLFMNHPILRATLLKVRAECVDIVMHRRFFKVDRSRSYRLEEFILEQKQWVAQVGKQVLKSWEENLRAAAEEASISCLNEKGFDVVLMNGDDEEDPKSGEKNPGGGGVGSKDSLAHGSKQDVKRAESAHTAPIKLTFTEQAARRNECRRLQRFVKLMDYMIVSTLHVMTVKSVSDLLRQVFQGCQDADVVVDSDGGMITADAEHLSDEVRMLLQTADAGESDADKRASKTNAPGSDGDDLFGGSGIGRGIQVGGVVVGPEVGTAELIRCDFDGFPAVLSRILRANMDRPKLAEAAEDPPTEQSLAVDTVKSGKKTEKGGKDEKKQIKEVFVPLFQLELLLNQKSPARELYFAPSLTSFLAAIDELLKLYITTVQGVNLLSNSIPYLNPANLAGGAYSSVRGLEETESGEGPQATAIIMEGGYFKEICGRIRGALVGIFANAARWISTWEEVRQMWIENETFNALAAVQESAGHVSARMIQYGLQPLQTEGGLTQMLLSLHAAEVEAAAAEAAATGTELHVPEKKGILEIGATVSARDDGSVYSPLVSFFDQCLAKYSSQRAAMTSIPLSNTINNLSIDTKTLKGLLVPSPERCFAEVAKMLPGLSRDKSELLLNEVQAWVRTLNAQPQTVEGFVEYLGWLERVRDSTTLVEMLQDEVAHLYGLLEQYRIPIQPTDLALYQTLSPTVRQMKESLDMGSDTKDDNITKFSAELEKAVIELMSEVSEVRNRAQDPMVLNAGASSEMVIKFLEELRAQLDKLEELKRRYDQWGDLFKSGGTTGGRGGQPGGESAKAAAAAAKSTDLEETRTEVELKRTLWVSMNEWNSITSVWKNQPFDSLNPEDVNSQITTYLKTVYTLDKGLPPNDVVPKLKAMVDEYRAMYSTIVDLRNPALKPRHWEKIQDAIGKAIVKDETFTLATLLESRIFDFKEEIGNVSSQAGSEAALEEMLGKVVKSWNEAEFTVATYRDAKDVFILGTVEDIQTLLEDCQVTISTIKSSRFIGPIKGEVDRWDKQLSLFSETLEAWLICQRNWLYLESIFSAPDIQRQLPDEARMFSQVDRTWKDIMRKVARNPNAMKSGTMPGLLESLQQNNVLLDQIQKCLEDYLESKRLLFPRFYFLSNEELLEILSQTRNPQAVQPHLGKCFDAIKSLEFSSADPKSIDIVAMISPEGERVPFIKTLKARGNVEAWLGSVEEAMVTVLRRLVKLAFAEYEDAKRSDWLKEHVGQVIVTANQVMWTKDVTEAIKSSDPNKGLINLRQKCINNLSATATLVRGELTKIQRATLGALITIDVHNRDIVSGLIAAKVTGLADFEWTKQMRYYWDAESDVCSVRMSSSVFTYGYEYLGCSPRLVITPLTDRCYLTLTGALQLNLGGSPVGPAGTGKTETVKDLAKALAKQCVVFNCSDGLDYKMMGKMFAGLAQSGAWCCFDEFNRIDIEVLSVIAQQLLTIKAAKDVKAIKFMFEGREIRLIDTCAAFITMNPGYAGRTELPDNLKALFRPIAMMIPDYGLIAEIMLFSEGFEDAKTFAGKVVNLYKLCSEQLSQQDHYDFGMRAVKSVLVMAGALKRASPELAEEVVLIRSLRDSNLPKFLAEDIGLFRGILQDLFPGVVVVEKDFGLLTNAIHDVMKERNLEIVESFTTRVCQLYETMRIRHGVMLVGPTGGGKTTCYEVLRDACTKVKEKHPSNPDFQKIKTWVLNPKCVAMTELYGEFNLATMEWKDGLIGCIFRAQVADDTPDDKWTVLDGPVDALWIENMNTVLDDNKLLTLINGERIKMNNTMHMLFEVADLAVASPATVSRCGMVFMDPASLGWSPYVQSWSRKLPDYVSTELKEYLKLQIKTYVPAGLAYIRKLGREFIRSVDFNIVVSLCNLLSTFLNRKGEIDFNAEFSDLRLMFSHVFVFCYVWALGGNLADGAHDFFDSFLRELLDSTPMQDLQLPSSQNVFCYYVDLKHKTFSLWDDIVPHFSYSADIPFFQMIVPTPDTVKYSFLLDELLKNGYRTLFIGNSGVGKSVIVQDLLNRISKPRGYVPVTLNFSAQTNSAQTQQMMELKLEKKRKNILGAPTGSTKIVLFVDDLNMPKLDTYGSQPPIELIRQYIDFGGFYDREKLTWKAVQDIELVACCAPPGGGRNNVTPRFIRHFNLLSIPVPSEISLAKIFRSIMDGFLKPFTSEVRQTSDAILNSAIEIYRSMCNELLPTPAKSHYTFNLRDLSKVIQGILQVRPPAVQTRSDIARTFIHEASRIFHDRLIDDSDRQYFNKLLSDLVEKNFGVSIPKDTLSEKPILFGDFIKRGVPQEDRQYVELADMKVLTTVLEEYLEEYNVTMSKENRREDLKKLYRVAGVEGKNTVFLLTDTQIKQETFLEDINSILNSGDVPNLFETDEREKILGDVRPIAREKGLPEDRDSVYQFFINRVRDNLHIVLATSPVGDTFRNRCRMFPSLVNCSTLDWFDEWPREALLSVSRRFFEFVDFGGDEMREKIAQMCVEIHSSVGRMATRFYAELRRRYYTTPTSYLELINLYTSMLQEKRKELGSARDRLRNGLNKLAETNELVANMQIELEQLGPELKQRAADVEILMVKIAKDQEMADSVRKVVSDEEATVREKATATEAIATEAQKDLDQALPALNAAYKALDALDKKDIAELKVFTKPPDLVLMVMEAICILFKVKPDWENSKKILSDPQLMKKMTDYDKDNIPEALSKKLRKYTENPNFNAEAVEKVSKACKSMCMWVIAMEIYSRVFKEVLPKKRRLEEAQSTLESTRQKLAEKTAALQEVESQLDKLKQKYETSIKSKKVLAEKMEETTRRLARASKLTLALADEQIRWTESVDSLNQRIDSLVGNIFLCSACVAYTGAFTSTYRQDLVIQWIRSCQEIGIPISENLSLVENLADPAVVRDWNIQGLPADQLSIENGILVTRGRRWPLMIDPQGQANRWIRAMEGPSLKVIKFTEAKFLRSLENAIRTGQSVLLEDVGEQLDPAIEPLLLKQTVRQGGRLLMKLGDSLVEYDRNFKLFITTKLPNPHYLPEVCIKVTIINFTVTKTGLEGQLLADVVKIERPELEEQRNSLIVNIANDKKQLKDIEEKILKLLFASEGNILDDEELINTLNQSKVTSAAIKERVVQAESTEKEINIAREKYWPVAIRGSVIYFVIAELAEIDSMYQFSLKYFKNLFNQCIIESEKSDDLQRRIATLCKNTTYNIFLNVSRGLFEAHKLLFAFMICIAIMRQSRQISEPEWTFFLRGGNSLGKEVPPRPNARWLNQNIWQNCNDLANSLEVFNYITEHISVFGSEWEPLMDSENPYDERVPGDSSGRLTPFQRLILVKVLREEKLVPSCIQFVSENIGNEFIAIPPLDLTKVYRDTSSRVPLIFILSTGSDPITGLMKLAAGMESPMTDRLHMISLGQGQGPIAEELLRRSTVAGDWLFLQNCHLAASWMAKLEAVVKDLSSPDLGGGASSLLPDIHSNFRLFLSSMPSPVFPIAVLQEGVKVTNEPPKGLRANLARSFSEISRDLFDLHPPQGIRFKKLLFGVCFFNALIHERKKFGPLGWNIMYDWSNSDLEVAITLLKNILQESKQVPWDALLYLTGDIVFGGRVTDDWDRRTLKSILAKFYTSSILDDAYRFSPSGIYFAPGDLELTGYRSYIDSLPFTEEPSIFGMHENANISFQMQESKRVVRTILDVQPRLVSASGGKSSEEIVTDVASAILENLPEPLVLEPSAPNAAALLGTTARSMDAPPANMIEVLFKKDSAGRMLNSLSTVLGQEAVRFNKLLAVVKGTLENLIKAVKGLVVMSSELEKVFTSLLNNEVPKVWSNAAYPSLKPLAAWIKDLQARIHELATWIEKGQPPCFWLPGFFFPQGFLTGVLQNHARKYNIAIDSLLFAFKVSDYDEGDPRIALEQAAFQAKDVHSSGMTDDIRVTYPDEDGVLVRGLFIEGARWDRSKKLLQDSYPMEMFSVNIKKKRKITSCEHDFAGTNFFSLPSQSMPLVRFIPTQIPQQQDKSLYVCPLYKTSARAGTLSTTGHSTNFVISLNLPSDRPQDYWVSKGVALLLSGLPAGWECEQ